MNTPRVTDVADDFDTAYRARLEAARPQIACMAALFRLTDVAAHPVSVEEFAAALGEPIDRAQTLIGRYGGQVARVDNGLVHLQLTFADRPDRFRIEIGGRVLNTSAGGCAGDIFAVMLWTGKPLRVASNCPMTGTRIRIELTPEGVTGVDPATAVISIADPYSAKFDQLVEDPTSEVICRQQNFYASAQAAADDPADIARPTSHVEGTSAGLVPRSARHTPGAASRG